MSDQNYRRFGWSGWLARRHGTQRAADAGPSVKECGAEERGAGGSVGVGRGMGFSAAAEYSSAHGGIGLYAIRANGRGGEPVFEQFGPLRDADTPHLLASVSKTLCAVMALAACSDGLLSLDECVAQTLTPWAQDARKARVTLRHLLSMCSGLQFVPPPGVAFDAAAQLPLVAAPDTVFDYNGANFQVFGAVLRRKLGGAVSQPLEWFQQRVLEPIGMVIDDWRSVGYDPFLPGGVSASARQMAKLGALLLESGRCGEHALLAPTVFPELLRPAPHAPHAPEPGLPGLPGYGLGVWLLAPLAQQQNQAGGLNQAAAPVSASLAAQLAGAYMAAGLGGQRLYVIPSRGLAIVRQGRLLGAFGGGRSLRDAIGGHGFEDVEFLRRLLA